MSYDPRAYALDPIDSLPTVTVPVDAETEKQVPAIRRCVRCGAYVADPELHDRWHGAMDK